eukprot:7242815-Prymnesium_polylepis.2
MLFYVARRRGPPPCRPRRTGLPPRRQPRTERSARGASRRAGALRAWRRAASLLHGAPVSRNNSRHVFVVCACSLRTAVWSVYSARHTHTRVA